MKVSSPTAISALYKPIEDIALPSQDKLVAFRDLIMSAWTGKVEVDETLSEVSCSIIDVHIVISSPVAACPTRFREGETGRPVIYVRRPYTQDDDCKVCCLLIGLAKH